ncbi:hypothetical protein G3T14_01680 [Methylobacterium sp. BTF04]|uniref:flagellar biosynthetic protein FliO n=1 Tax=Methylobacterium sp. BTF04 TaxID=2708300 RepID=UPI0013D4201C|nr:flagellar biosynthetic protein FliO [Methylobacterium sp. BTF04]NEU10842.1 hypothetical protein [Methylobacterium sp. BTF04]
MSSFFSSDGSFSLQFAIIFVVIFVVLAATVFAFRRLTGKGTALASKSGSRGRQPRLGIVDVYELDRQRQLILLRRDNVEHLLLVGGPNDVVIERNINRNIGARFPAEELADDESSPENGPAVAYEPSPPQAAPYLEPSFEMPVVVPTPPPGSASATPSIGRPLDDALVTGRFDVEPDPQPIQAPPPRTAAARLAGAIRRNPPSLVNLVPDGGPVRARPADEVSVPVKEPVVEAVLDAVPAPPPPMVAPTASRAIDAAILTDMARQLEEALRRPAAAVRPAQPQNIASDTASASVNVPHEESRPEPVAAAAMPAYRAETVNVPAPQHHEEEPAESASVDPMAAAMASAQGNPTGNPEGHGSDDLFEDHDAEAASIVHTEPQPIRDEPSPPVFFEIEPQPIAPQPPAPISPTVPDPQPQAPQPPKPASATPNPFSVEEIEAEFARLLGRPLDRKN